ncbi:hypothetical protein [Flammeovirga aprica]|uniref:Uncharacterized protein n=1 Tax=Flammeovirga aprica JL-4 TaxID=694437 RepID=A0A7X9RWY1_9BACT|nr:hypothetical protein [Flammeovirga aprica]NME70223.1 hypothetical protein [Flammeovirga aprica JL-4]
MSNNRFVFTILFLIGFFLFPDIVYGQIKKKHINKIPKRFSDEYIITQEVSVGQRLSYKVFKNGVFQSASNLEVENYMNTILLGTATELFDHLKNTDPNFEPTVVKANGMTSTTFYISYSYSKGEIFIIRSMSSGKLILDPLAAENPKNYSLLFAFNFENEKDKNQIENFIKDYTSKNNIEFIVTTK